MLSVLLLLVTFLVIWIAADFALRAVEKLAGKIPLSRFTISLFVLGAATSIPEIGVTANSLLLDTPQVAIGTLLGGQLILLFGVIPFFALMSRGLQLKAQVNNASLAITLIVALVPMVAFLDQGFSVTEALITLAIYAVFVITFVRQDSLMEQISQRLKPQRISVPWELLKIVGAGVVLFIATNTAVREMIELSALLNLPRFLVSFLILPIGTNLPELALGIKGAIEGKKDLALGDYLGSMTFNSLLLVILSVLYGGVIILGQSISILILVAIAGMVVFWLCCRSNKVLSMAESLLLLLFYLSFVVLAWWQGFATAM